MKSVSTESGGASQSFDLNDIFGFEQSAPESAALVPDTATPEACNPVVSRLSDKHVSVRTGSSVNIYRIGDGYSFSGLEKDFEIHRESEGRIIVIKGCKAYSGVIDKYVFSDEQEAGKFVSEFIAAVTGVSQDEDELEMKATIRRESHSVKSKFARTIRDGCLLAGGALVVALAAGLGWSGAEWLRLEWLGL